MQQLFPPSGPIEVYDAYRPADPAAPLLRLNMVMSLDGRIVDAEGLSSGLGGEGDLEAFMTMRHLADAILVGARTVRAEDYGPMRVREGLRPRREADGRRGPAPIVVVSRSLRLDPQSRLFEAEVGPFVLTTADAAPGEVIRLRDAGATVVQVGRGRVDLVEGIQLLRAEHGMAHLLCEGGPDLNGQLIAAGLVDEVCLTLSSALVGGTDARRIVDRLVQSVGARLEQVLEQQGELLLRYSLR